MRKPDGTHHNEHEPGDYSCGVDGWWQFRTPNGIYFKILAGDSRYHELTEHEDGTVTLSPSVKCSPGSCGVAEGWHGFIKRGVWKECL